MPSTHICRKLRAFRSCAEIAGRCAPLWIALLCAVALGLVAAIDTPAFAQAENEGAERDRAAGESRTGPDLEAEVDAIIEDPGMGPAERVARLESLLREYRAPDEPWAYRAADTLGRIYLASGDAKLAIPYLEFAVRGISDDADLLNTLGYLFATEKIKLGRAVELVSRAIEIAPDDTAAQTIGFYRDSLGWAYFQQGKLDSAIVHLEAANQLAPGTGEIREHLVDAYAALRRVDEATDILIEDLVASRGVDPRLRARLRRLHRTTPEGRPIAPEREVEKRVREMEAEEIVAIEARGGQVVRIMAADGLMVTGTLLRPARPSASARANGRGNAERREDSGLEQEDGGREENRGHDRTHPGVILVHMLGSERGEYDSLAQRCREAGMIVLSIDVRGHGASVSPELPGMQAFREDFPQHFDGAVKDVTAAVAFMLGQEGVDPERIAIVGASMGGLWSVFGDRELAVVRAMVLLSPGLTEDLTDAMSEHPERPTLLVASSDDPSASFAADHLYLMLDPEQSRVVTFSDAGRGTDMLKRVGELEPMLVLWLEHTIGQRR